MRGYTIFDHAQLGHPSPEYERQVAAKMAKARKAAQAQAREEARPPRPSKWFSSLGLGPQFQKRGRA